MSMNIDIVMPETKTRPDIRVIGLGGAGGNAVNNMIRSGLSGVEFIVANTDVQDLEKSLAETKIQIGVQTTRGLGAGASPEVGRQAAEENLDEIRRALEGADMVFITAGLGGGTGTGSSPVVADVARDQGSLTVAVVTKPFTFEGKKRTKVAEAGAKELKGRVDTLITIHNNNLLADADKNATALEMLAHADDILHYAARSISDLANNVGMINCDFNDLRTIMAPRGNALMGTGIARGDDRAQEAAKEAMSSPLLGDLSINGAKAVMVNLTSGPDLGMVEIQDAVSRIHKEVDEEADLIWGWVIDEDLKEEVRVTVIATGIGLADEASRASYDLEAFKREAIDELRQRQEHDIDRPTFLRGGERMPAQAVAGGAPQPIAEGHIQVTETLTVDQPISSGGGGGDISIDRNDTNIPTFLRRCAD